MVINNKVCLQYGIDNKIIEVRSITLPITYNDFYIVFVSHYVDSILTSYHNVAKVTSYTNSSFNLRCEDCPIRWFTIGY